MQMTAISEKRAYVESLSALIAGSEDEDMYDKINERLSYVYPYTSSKKSNQNILLQSLTMLL